MSGGGKNCRCSQIKIQLASLLSNTWLSTNVVSSWTALSDDSRNYQIAATLYVLILNQPFSRSLTVFAVVVDVFAVLSAPHDVGFRVARCLASECHVGSFAHYHIRTRLSVHNTRRNCNTAHCLDNARTAMNFCEFCIFIESYSTASSSEKKWTRSSFDKRVQILYRCFCRLVG